MVDVCGGLGPVINLLKNVVLLLQFLIPIGLIIFGVMDLGKAVIAGKEDEMKKAQGTLIKRVIYAVAVYLVVAIVSIVVNAINIPIGLALLNNGKGGSTQMINKSNPVLDALKEPVCWAPILAVILVLLGIRFPTVLDPNFELIAKANSGVAVFAAGLTLSGMKFQLDGEVVYNTLLKLVLMPAILLIVGLLFHMEADKLQMMVLAGALPPAFSGIIIGNQYQLYERTGTSSLAFSILLFVIAAPFWIWVTHLVS
jgi:predicted permease